MEKWVRMKYQPCAPLGEDGRPVSCCKEHTDFTRRAAAEGMVLLKNDGILPLKKGKKVAVFGKAQVDTFARRYEDYPSAASFGKGETHEKYYEDIYVGYRYFETVPGAAEVRNTFPKIP